MYRHAKIEIHRYIDIDYLFIYFYWKLCNCRGWTRNEEGKTTNRLEPQESELKLKSTEEAGEQLQCSCCFACRREISRTPVRRWVSMSGQQDDCAVPRM